MCDSSSLHQFSSRVLVMPVSVRLHLCDSAILSVQVRKKFGITVATFTQPGPLGLRFVASTTTDEEAVEVLGIQPDSQAASQCRKFETVGGACLWCAATLFAIVR